MNTEEMNYMTELTIELIKVGQNNGVIVRAMNLPGKIWLNWEDMDTGNRGTAQIDGAVSNAEHGTPVQCAEQFIEFICKKCDQVASYEAY